LWVFAQAVVFPFLFGWTTAPGRMLETLLAAIGAPFGLAEAPPAAEAWQSWRYLGMWAFLTLWFMAKGMFKNVPDFTGDSLAGVRTSATICGDRKKAAQAATAATVLAYASLGALGALGLVTPRAMLSLVWLAPVAWNCLRLIRARDGASGNAILKTDMVISSGFIATLLLLVAPSALSLVVVGLGALIFSGSDLLGLDSRRDTDAEVRLAPAAAESRTDVAP
jgi:4-hydroxybenzoate polyprenyltransferase